ncbi:D-2-hydroxyacid dehydrogenase [Rubellicoccus peritrichatus]|uniref:D-2-hydroxyacid dehydrogenase n=1 Tax=Rubellicoccus peritrichatus TaxID=3080537 RepID=A0AAQ3LCI7_9BACT|nr:D-2-hydroxyacid dehydrogenase [Puniceicoccus sp. CR14]WOO41949.1 D-2-hydroxyacid dehydrogenase [Puniceicoccus sp. CR14]
MKIVVLDAETFYFEDESPWTAIAALGGFETFRSTEHEESVIIDRCADADIVLTNKVPLNRKVIDALPSLKMIGVLATGFNIIDIEAARERRIPVCNVPDYSSSFVAQHTVALIMALANRTASLDAWVQEGGWKNHHLFTWWDKPLVELDGLTLGIVGFGTIGRKVATIMRGMGMKIAAHSRSRRDAPDWDNFAWADIDQLFQDSDIVSLHCPQTPENTGFINRDLLHSMKSSAFLINTARGGLIDEQALRDALDTDVIAGAALDVVSKEPMAANCPLYRAKNCIITPHVAWSSFPARQRLLEVVEENILAFLERKPINVVNG